MSESIRERNRELWTDGRKMIIIMHKCIGRERVRQTNRHTYRQTE